MPTKPKTKTAPFIRKFVVIDHDDPTYRWGALDAAKDWLESIGCSVGSMERYEPIGVMVGEWDVQKWRNLSAKDRAELDGTITVGEGGTWEKEAIATLNFDPTKD